MLLLTRGPWPWSEKGRGVDRPNPATAIAGGEGGGAWEVHQVRAHLYMPGIEVGVDCSGGVTRAGRSAAEKNGGGGAPVSYSGGNRAEEDQ